MMYPLPNGMDKYVSDYRTHVLDVKHMSKNKLEKFTGEAKAVFGFLKYCNSKTDLLNFVKENETQFKNMSSESAATLAELLNAKVLTNYVQPLEKMEGGVNMCKALDDLQNDVRAEGRAEGRVEGRAEGRVEGRAEGMEQEKIKILKNMRKAGLPEDKIKEILNA